MTWWSEYNAVPRFVLAKLAIRCRFVDRFVGSRVPSRVSGQRFSTHDTSLPSVGSRRARFPVFIGTMKALRLPARANLVPYGSVAGSTRPSCVRVRRSAPNERGGSSLGLEHLVSRRSMPGCCTRGRVRDLAGFLAIHPTPLPCSKTPAEPTRPRLWRSCRHRPRPTQTEGLSGYIISRLTQGFSIRCLRFTSDVAVSHARLASGWRAAPLPGGGRTLWIAAKGFRLHYHSPFQDLSCRKGGLHQGAVRGAGAGAALSLALHPSRRHLQPPIGRRRRQCHRLPVEGLPHRPARPLEDDDALPA